MLTTALKENKRAKGLKLTKGGEFGIYRTGRGGLSRFHSAHVLIMGAIIRGKCPTNLQ